MVNFHPGREGNHKTLNLLKPVVGPGAANENNDEGVAAGAGGSQRESAFTLVQVD